MYGRRPVREALRGRREVLELWAGERALAAEPWLREAPVKVQVKPERALTEAVGTRDHQGVVAWTEPYRYADAWELAGGERPLIAALDQVTDPRNLGAVCRSAEGAGASGVVVPAHGSVVVDAGRSRRRLPARWSICRSRSFRTSRATSPRSSGPTSGSTRPPATPRRRSGRPTSPAARLSCSVPKDEGCARWCGGRAIAAVSIPLAAKVESLNVSVAAALLLYEARRQRG